MYGSTVRCYRIRQSSLDDGYVGAGLATYSENDVTVVPWVCGHASIKLARMAFAYIPSA